MSAARPARQPAGDALDAALIRVMGRVALAAHPSATTDVLWQGPLVVRYGVRVLGKPFLSVVPGLVALDYGQMLVGEEALRFLLGGSNLHPRADVLGYRNDGTDDMLPVKRLDLATPLMVLAYPDDTATLPLAEVSALVGLLAPDPWPARLINSLPHFPDSDAWRAALRSDADAPTDPSS